MFQEYPDFVARFYDVVYAHLRDTVDRAWYLARIAECSGPVLEIGVGTGRLFRDAIAAGADIYGVDMSEAMIRQLRAHTDPALHDRVWVGDACELSSPRSYELILAPFRVLSHVETTEAQLRLLDRVHQHLEPGGRFIFDLYVPSPRMIADGIRDRVDFDGEYSPGRKLRRISSAESDVVSQTSRVTMTYVWDDDGGQARGEHAFLMRFFFQWELVHLIARSPLRLERIDGDFQGHALGPDSKEFVVVCRRD